jgi:hypothetical protein
VTEIGAMYKKFRGFFNEVYSSADTYLLKGECIDNTQCNCLE